MSTAYDEWAARRDASRQGRVKAVIEGAPPIAPQQASEIDSLSREFGVPSEVIRADPDIFKRQREVARAAQTVDSAPRLGDWLTRGEMNAAKAKDSLPQLSHVEAALKAPLARPPEWFKLPEGADLSAYMTGPAAALTRWLQPKIERGIEGTINTAHDAWQSGEFRWKDAAKSLGAGFGDIGAFGLGLAEIGARHNLYTGGSVNPQNEENAQIFGAIGDRLQAWADEFGPKANNQAVADVYSGVRSIPFSAAAILSGGLTGSAAAGAATVGALTGGGSYRRGKAEGLSEGQALFYGTVDAAIETGTEIGPLAKIFGHVGSGTSFGKKLWQSFLSEIPNEQIATLGQDFNQWAMIDAAKGKTFNDFLAERWDAAKSTAIATIIGSGTVLSATHAMEKVSNRVAVRFQRAENAARTEQLVTRLEEIAKAAPIAVRDPESFAEFVKHAADGTEATDVFIAADKLAEVFEQSGLNEEQIAQALPGVPEQFKTAVLTGGDIRIPIEDLAARSGDLANAMTKHLRLDPNDYSIEEAKTFMQSAQDDIAKETEAMFEKVSEGNAFRAEIDQVRQQVADELNAAGRFTPETHTAYAALYGNFFGRLAQDLGESPLAVAGRYGLKVKAEGVAGGEVLDQSKWDKILSDQREIEGLRAAIRDPQTGKVYTGGSHQSIINSVPPMDDTGLYGRLSGEWDRSTENAGFVDREGNFISRDEANERWRILTMEDRRDFIRDRGRGAYYSQIDELLDPTLPAQVAAFRNWFGDSKVVDANGDPLVVYHGTNQDVSRFVKKRGGQATTKNAAADKAFFFTSDSDEAGQYAENAASRVVSDIAAFEKKRAKLQQEVNRLEQQARRTGDWDAYERAMSEWEDLEIGATQEDDLTGRNIMPVYLSLQNPLIVDFGPVDGAARVGYLDRIASQAKKAGHDGIILRNISDSPKGGITSTHYAVFKPEQIKSTNNRGTWDANDARILYQQDEDNFYSALQRAIENSKQPKGPATQWKATLQNAPGVKPDELQWSGVLNLLDVAAKTNRTVTKDELLALFDRGGIVVREVVLGGQSLEVDDDYVWQLVQENRRDYQANGFDPEAEGLVGSVVRETFGTHPDLFDGATYVLGPHYFALDGEGNRLKDDEGNDSFETREEAQDVVDAWQGEATEEFWEKWEEQETELVREREEEYLREDTEADGAAQFATYTTDPDEDSYRELLLTLPPGEGKNPERAPLTHWDPTGVVAHLRFMEKHHADGSPVLFIEEVQSDWHQKGRDEGYAQPADPAKIAEAQAKYDAASARFQAADKVIEDLPLEEIRAGTDVYRAAEAERNAAREARYLAQRELDVANGVGGGVPLAPFQKSWPELVMKRAIRWAVDNGYKRIAWTTGQQQAERYNLSEAVGAVTVQRAAEGTAARREGLYRVSVSNGTAANTLVENGLATTRGYGDMSMTEAQMKEAFGVDIAKRMVEGAEAAPVDDFLSVTDTDGQRIEEHAKFTLEGEDLQVGGEGMKAFYDRNLVNITNSLIKKHGGKVAPMPIREFTLHPRLSATVIEIQRVAGLAAYGIENRAQAEQRLADYETVIADPQTGPRVREEMQMSVVRLKTALPLIDKMAALKAEPIQPTNFGFEITPKLAEVAAGGFPLFQKTGKSRGQIAFGEDITETPSVITLLRSANLSTFLHETGHFFLQVSIDVASRPDAPERVLKDVDTFFKWTGVRGLTEWNAMGIDEQREHHERFARGFEAYLMEGKAPSLELRSLFATFRSWLLSVYQSLTRLNVTLTDEVRSVFDRMLATDSEIEEAQHDFGFQPAFSEKPPAMTDAEWENYQALGADAQREAASQLERRSLNDMRYGQRAMDRALKAAQKSVDGLRKATRQEVAADVAGEPVYRAMAFMRSSKLNGVPWDGPTKINTESLEALYEDKPVLYANEIKARLRGMTAADGLNVNQIAELFGFTSGDHMVQEILLAPPIRDAIEGEVDQRMLERYGDLTSPQAVEAAAIKAVHNDVRGRFIATEMRMATGAVGKPRLLAAAAKRFAEDAIARVKVRNLRPAQYEAAERRANSAAVEALAADDIARFGVEKRNQLVNFYGARVARDALDEVRSILKYLTKFEKAGTRKALDPDYTDQIDAMLERFDLRVSTTNKQADKRKSLASWIERMKDMGFEPVISDKLLDEANRTPYRELTVEELRGLRDAVKNIEHLGRLKKKLLTAKDQRDFADAVNDITDEIETNAFKTVVQPVGARTWLEGVKGHFDDFVAMHRKLANFTYIMGGNKYGGALWTRIMLPLNEAGDRETVMKQDAMLKLRDLFSVLKDDNLTKKTYEPGIDDSISLETRLLVALNWGNEGNRQRIMDGDKWTEDQVNAVLAPLTETHWRFVQSVWDYINGFWPEIAAKERRVTGIVPEKVEALPFEMNGVQMRGGYFPIKYDPARSAKAEADTAAEVLQQMLGGKYTNAQTRRGHTKARVENVDRPLRKDFGVIFGHVNQVIHDLTHHEALIDANRLLRAAGVDGAIRNGYGPAAARWMREALNDIAVGDIPAQNGLEVIWNYLRTGATTAGLGWNLWTSLLQPIGLTQSMSRIGSKWIGRGIAELFKDPAKMNAKIEWIYAQSDFMRHRGDTMQREIAELRNQISAKSPLRRVVEKAIPAEAVDAVQGSFFYMIGKAQLMADLPTWLGQYEKSIDAGKDPETAARIADQAVIDSQGSGMIKDLAGVQRGPALMKLWTNFYSYFSATYNLMADRVGELRRVGPSDLPYFAVDFALLSIIPATLTALLYHFLKGDDDDSLWSEIVNQNLSYMTGTMMMTREIGAIFAGNTGYTGPAGARLFDAISKFSVQVKQGEADEALARSANTVFGILLHYPAAQIDRTVRGTTAFANGEAGPAAPIVGPPPR